MRGYMLMIYSCLVLVGVSVMEIFGSVKFSIVLFIDISSIGSMRMMSVI